MARLVCVLLLLAAAVAVVSALKGSAPLRQQARFGLRQPLAEPVTVLDVVSVLCRFKEREDFYGGRGYGRPEDGNLLTAARFYERIKDLPFQPELWPLDENAQPAGVEEGGASKEELIAQLLQTPPSEEACNTIFTAFAKGASGGLAYPVQVDEELAKFLFQPEEEQSSTQKRVFYQSKLESMLTMGKLQVAIGWFLFIGLQFFAIYHLFLRPAVKYLAPDLYDVLY